MARCEPRSNGASQTGDTNGAFGAPAPARPPTIVGGPRISVVVVDGESAVDGHAVVGPPIHVVGHAAAGPDAMALVDRVRPDVVLLHVDTSAPAVSATIEALLASHPATRIVVADTQHDGENGQDNGHY